MLNNRAITTHFVTHWGVPSEIRQRKVPGFEEFAILEFPPGKGRAFWRYATNGMSNWRQVYSDSKIVVRTELYGCTEQKAPWIDQLLSAMATYPRDYHTCFAEWDTVEVGQPIDQGNSPYTGILLVPPGLMDAATVGLIGGLPENVLVHQLVGLLPSELQFAKCNSGRKLWQRLARAGLPLLDKSRTVIT